MNELTILAPAKINLCLSVLGRRTDGYHELEMLMQMVGLYDEVVMKKNQGGITITCDNGSVPAGPDNIAFRAALEMLGRAETTEGISIGIGKRIPVAAGLGGGSSDAAAVLIGCNLLLNINLSRKQLAEIGTRIGMDVPFFFYGPTALARGRGEVLTTVQPPARFWVLLVNPGFATSTAWVYNNLNLRLTKHVKCNNIAGLAIGRLAETLHNDLETVTASAHPVISRIKEMLMAEGALGARMSGSGPTVFGIFDSESACKRAAEILKLQGWWVYPSEILTDSPLDKYIH